jgi:lysophospholipase L1-like esterase
MHSYVRLGLLATVAGSLAANAVALFCQTPQASGAQAQPVQALPVEVLAAPGELTKIFPNDGRIELIGRIDDRDPLKPRLAYPGTEIRLRLQGASMRLVVESDSDKSALTVVVDYGAPRLQLLHAGLNEVVVNAMPAEGNHTIEIVKRTETWQGILTFESVGLPEGVTLLPPPLRSARKLMFVGDSVTCGAGVNNNATCKPDPENPANDVYNSYGLLLGRRLDAETQLVCYGGRGLVRDYRGLGVADNVLNAPQFLMLSVASDAPEGRVAWDANQFQPDAIVFSIGTNDFNLQKTKPLDEPQWIEAYVALLHSARALYPRAKFLATEGAIVTDPLLRLMLQKAVAQSADPLASYVPSQHYPGNGCDGHPTAAQHLQMTDDFETILRAQLGW